MAPELRMAGSSHHPPIIMIKKKMSDFNLGPVLLERAGGAARFLPSETSP